MDSLAHAFDRLDDFLAVQGTSPSLEAVTNLQAAAGIEAGERAVLRERVAALGLSDQAAAVLLGVVLGRLGAIGLGEDEQW